MLQAKDQCQRIIHYRWKTGRIVFGKFQQLIRDSEELQVDLWGRSLKEGKWDPKNTTGTLNYYQGQKPRAYWVWE